MLCGHAAAVWAPGGSLPCAKLVDSAPQEVSAFAIASLSDSPVSHTVRRRRDGCLTLRDLSPDSHRLATRAAASFRLASAILYVCETTMHPPLSR